MKQVQDELNVVKENLSCLLSDNHCGWHQPTITRIDMKKTMWAAGSPTDGTSSAQP